jgi:hypothetical protein
LRVDVTTFASCAIALVFTIEKPMAFNLRVEPTQFASCSFHDTLNEAGTGENALNSTAFNLRVDPTKFASCVNLTVFAARVRLVVSRFWQSLGAHRVPERSFGSHATVATRSAPSAACRCVSAHGQSPLLSTQSGDRAHGR